MPNRIIKETIRTSKKVSLLTDFQFRVWVYLITYVDDFGRGSADPEILKGMVFTRRKSVTEAQIEKALDDLANIGMISLYDVDGESFFYFPNWSEHQRVRTQVSKYPAPDDPAATRRNSPQLAADCGLNPIQSNPESRIQNPESRRAGARGEDLFSRISEYSDGDVELESALKDFVEMRKAIKKPLTDRALSMIFGKLTKLSEDRKTQIEIINQSVLHNWQDVYALKTEETPAKSKSSFETSELEKYFNQF